MAETATKLDVKTEKTAPPLAPATSATWEWEPIESLRRQVDRLFEDFGQGRLWRPFGSMFDTMLPWAEEAGTKAPAVDLVEKENAYEIIAEMPGMEPGNVEVTISNGVLTLKGEKKEEKEEKRKNYFMSERRFGSFRRSFQLPDGIDEEKIGAEFKNGVLTVMLPKAPEAVKPEKKISNAAT